MSSSNQPSTPWSRLSVIGMVLIASLSRTGSAQETPPTPAAAAPVATGFLGTCKSCISSLTGAAGKCCNTPLGKLINGAFKPIEFASGGVIPAPCPGPTDPAKHDSSPGGKSSSGGPPGPQQAAQAIKKDQAQAKARREAVQYLGTVPCHYYPEAEAALIQALRTDRSECVRWEAAHALAQGCCCTKKTIKALKIVLSGSQEDGNPKETSCRVQVEALIALEHCLAMCGELALPQRPEVPTPMPRGESIPTPIPQPIRPETPQDPQDAPASSTSTTRQVAYYEAVEKESIESLLADARRLVESAKVTSASIRAPRRGHSLLDLWQRSAAAQPTEAIDSRSTSSPVRIEIRSDSSE